MASISAELQQIRSASLARDVRSSIANAIEKVNSNTSPASAVSGVVVNLDNASDRTDTAIGDEIKASIQAGIMPVVYSAGKYAQVLKANPYSNCGTNYMTLYYPETGCSGFTMTSVDQRCS